MNLYNCSIVILGAVIGFVISFFVVAVNKDEYDRFVDIIADVIVYIGTGALIGVLINILLIINEKS